MFIVYRKLFLGAVLISAILLFFFALAWFSAERGASRTVNKLLDAFEVEDIPTIERIIDPAYADSAKFNREDIVGFARLLRGNMHACTVSRHENNATFDADTHNGTLEFTLRLNGKFKDSGSSELYSSSPPTATTFTLKRNSWKPWDWTVTAIETPYSDKARGYRARLQRRTEPSSNINW